jgi:hypothetical protein
MNQIIVQTDGLLVEEKIQVVVSQRQRQPRSMTTAMFCALWSAFNNIATDH